MPNIVQRLRSAAQWLARHRKAFAARWSNSAARRTSHRLRVLTVVGRRSVARWIARQRQVLEATWSQSGARRAFHRLRARLVARWPPFARRISGHLGALTAVALVAIAGAAYWWRSRLFADEGLAGNALTEAVGILITVIVIDRLVGAPERKRAAIARKLAHEEIGIIYARLCHLVTYPVAKTVKNPPKPGTPIANYDVFVSLSLALDLAGPAQITSKTSVTWEQFFIASAHQESERIGRAIHRYMQFADPSVMEALRKVEDCPFLGMLKLLPSIAAGSLSLGQKPRFPIPTKSQVQEWLPLDELFEALSAVQTADERGVDLLKPPRF